MGLKYQTINRSEQQGMLIGRFQAFERDHYNHGINIELLQAAQRDGDDSEDTANQIKASRAAQRTIERALGRLETRLRGLGIRDIAKAIAPPEDDEQPANRQAKRAAARKRAPAKAKAEKPPR